MKRNRTHSSLILIPVMLSFFVMGFVDLVGVAANHMKVDFELSDTMANLCPAMVFLWFLGVGALYLTYLSGYFKKHPDLPQE